MTLHGVRGFESHPLRHAEAQRVTWSRRGVRVAEGARLESVCAGNCTAGSNPALSANLVASGKPHGIERLETFASPPRRLRRGRVRTRGGRVVAGCGEARVRSRGGVGGGRDAGSVAVDRGCGWGDGGWAVEPGAAARCSRHPALSANLVACADSPDLEADGAAPCSSRGLRGGWVRSRGGWWMAGRAVVRVRSRGVWWVGVVVRSKELGSRASRPPEPRQTRKGAAIRGSLRAPRSPRAPWFATAAYLGSRLS